ncbi:hypothetical protein N0V82_008277 [Gnomoniopsis sp. IMI 355080]|nr:hypothetical protein N0V82_008277 [Gnomoniopsis sp. IMI 355080]
MSSSSRAPTENQLSPLHGPHVLITSHNKEGKAIVKETEPVKWVGYDEDKLSMAVLWTTKFPTDLNNEADIKLHRDRMAQGGTGLALGGGTVLRYVEFSPGYESVDYGIVTNGEVIAKFDSGEERLMHAGDVCIHETEWARMIFSLQDAKEIFINDQRYKEDGVGDGLPPSGNDN